MKRVIRNICILTVFLFVLGSILIPNLYGDRIIENLLKNITSKLKTNIEFENVNFSIVDHFPYASVTGQDIIILESNNFSSDTLLFAENAFVKFSLFEIFSEDFNLPNIKIENAKVFIKYNLANEKNFDILIKNTEQQKKLLLNNISFQNTSLNYNNERINLNFNTKIESINLKFLEGINQNIKLDFKSFVHHLSYNNQKYIKNKNLIFDGSLSSMNEIFEIQSSAIKLEELKSTIELKLLKNNDLNFQFNSIDQKIEDVINNTPDFLKEIYSSFNSNGKVSFSGIVNNNLEIGNPHLELDYKLYEANFKMKKNPFLLKNLSGEGKISNGKNNNFETSSVTFNKFKSYTNAGNISGDFKVSNFNKYKLLANLNYDLDLEETNYYNLESPFYEMKGRVNGKLDYNGIISFDDNAVKNIIEAEKNGTYSIKNSSFFYKKILNKIFIDSTDGLIVNNKLELNKSNIKIGESSLVFSGEIINLFQNIYYATPTIQINGGLKSSKINFNDIINSSENDTNSVLKLANYLDANINLDVENFIYNKLIVKNITGLILYKDLAFSTENFMGNTLTGNISMNGKFYQKKDNSFKLSINSKLEELNIKTMFYCFDNFDQDYIKYENLDGKISSQFICNAELDNKLNFVPEMFQLSSKLTISDGELISFQPMEKLSKFVSLEDLKHIKFSTLKNNIEIKDQIINIPSMEIKSNALSIIISGYHKFNLEYNYKIKMLLGQILSKTFKTNNTDYKNNDEVITNVQVRMIGDEDNFDIKFEKLKIKEHINKGIKEEIQTIKKIIREDIVEKKEMEVKEDEIEIEWDDNF